MRYSLYARVSFIFFALLLIAAGCAPAFTFKDKTEEQQTTASSLKSGVLATFKTDGEYFSVWVTNLETIKRLYELDSNPKLQLIPSGPILAGAGEKDHNLPYHWHLDPELTHLVAASQGTCSATPSIVEETIDMFLQYIGNYCPSGAVLIRLLDYRFPPPGILRG
jgi:hypothetical protein